MAGKSTQPTVNKTPKETPSNDEIQETKQTAQTEPVQFDPAQIQALLNRVAELEQKLAASQTAQPSTPKTPQDDNFDKLRKDRALEMKAKLDKEPKVPFFVPLGYKEKAGAQVVFQINGYTVYVRKGVQYDLPKTLVKMANDSMQGTFMASQPFLADRDTNIQNSLNGGITDTFN